jgi:hypothetical protein
MNKHCTKGIFSFSTIEILMHSKTGVSKSKEIAEKSILGSSPNYL